MVFQTSVEVPAPFSGKIVEFLVEDGSKVTAKQKLYKMEKGEGGGQQPSAAAPSKPAEPEQKKETKPPKPEITQKPAEQGTF